MNLVKVYTKVVPATKLQVQCTLVINDEEPKVFVDRDKFNAELKRRNINLTEIQYYHDKSVDQ